MCSKASSIESTILTAAVRDRNSLPQSSSVAGKALMPSRWPRIVSALRSQRISTPAFDHSAAILGRNSGATLESTSRVSRALQTVGRWTFVDAKREMFDVAIYSLAFIHAITGLKVESVIAHTGNYFFAEHAGVGVEDFGAMATTLEGGVTATAIGGRFGWMSHPKSGPQRVVVVGTEGTVTFDAFRPRIEVYNDAPDFTLPPVDPVDPMGMWGASRPDFEPQPKHRWVALYEEHNAMTADVAAFIDCIEQGREPKVNATVAASLLEVILAGYVSAARGEAVSLPLPRG